MDTLEFTQINQCEWSAVDPQTGGTWKVVAAFPISEVAALWAITDFLKRESARPAMGSVLTIVFSIRVGEEGELSSQI